MAAIAFQHLWLEVGCISDKRPETVPDVGGRLRIPGAKRIGISSKTGSRVAALACAAITGLRFAGGGRRIGRPASQAGSAVTGPVVMRPCAAEVACRRSGGIQIDRILICMR